jgi:hypothetical protein
MENELPPPGIYYNVDYPTYARWDAMRSSALFDFSEAGSPLHYALGTETDSAVTADMHMGTAIHTLLFEPEKADDEIAVKPTFGRNKADKEEKLAFDQNNAGKTILTEEQYHNARIVVQVLRSHPVVGELLRGADFEVSLVWPWDDENHCKGRTDVYHTAGRLIADLKTTSCGLMSDTFRKKLARYYRQLAWNGSGFANLGIEIDYFGIIAVETEPPFGVRIITPPVDDLRLCARVNAVIAERYALARRNSFEDSYPVTPTEIGMTGWQRMELQKLVEEEENHYSL